MLWSTMFAAWLALCTTLLNYCLLLSVRDYGWPISLPYQYLSVSQVGFSPLPKSWWLQTLSFALLFVSYLFDDAKRGKIKLTMHALVNLKEKLTS